MEGKIALVTGGAQGIGKAYCTELLKNGATVIICDIDKVKGEETCRELQNQFGKEKSTFYICDVTDPKQFEGCFKDALDDFGFLDIVVNNAGICDETEDGWIKTIDINLVGVIRGTKLGFSYMSRSNGGRGGIIVNIASITSLDTWEIVPVYSATKAAVNQFSRSIGTDIHFKNTGVKVVSINPGITDTKILKEARELVISEEVREIATEFMGNYPLQGVENMGKGFIQVILTAANGSLWTIEDNKPPQLTVLK